MVRNMHQLPRCWEMVGWKLYAVMELKGWDTLEVHSGKKFGKMVLFYLIGWVSVMLYYYP